MFNIVLKTWLNTDTDFYWYIALAQFVIIFPLCFIRNIKVFSKLSIIGDVAVLLTLITLSYTSIKIISDDKNFNIDNLKLIDVGWAKVIGMCITSLEGIGVLLPIKVYSP